MCCQCGDIYYQAGYKIIQVPVPGAAPTPSPFAVKEEPAATQEPAGPPKLKTEPVATQEPVGSPKLKTEPYIATKEAPTFVNKFCTDNAYGGIYTSQPDQSLHF
jgi:hypothetical protein